MHAGFESLVAIPITISFLDDNTALGEQTFEHRANIELVILSIAHAEGNILEIAKKCHAGVKEHLQDVMHAARIKKGTTLLQRGLSIGQAAGLMGLSNWDLQSYAAHTTAFEPHTEAILARVRMGTALKLFGAGKA